MKKVEFTIEVDRTVTIRRVHDDTLARCTECSNKVERQPGLREDAAGARPGTGGGRLSLRLAENEQAAEYVINPAGYLQSPPAGSNASTLTKEALDGLLAYLDPDPELAGQKYELIRTKLVKLFECRGCACPEDYADVTIDIVAAKISNGLVIQASNIPNFFYGVARNVLRDYWRQVKKQPLSLECINQPVYSSDDSPGLRERMSEQEIIEQQLSYLDMCLQELPQESRDLIIQYYMGQEGSNIKSRKFLAEQLAIPLNALRIRVHRVRAKLRRRMCELLCEN